MPSNLQDDSDLPPAGGYQPSEQAKRIYAAQQAEEAAGADGVDFDTTYEPTTIAAYNALKANEASKAMLEASRKGTAENATQGIYAADVSTKVEEGAQTMLSTFGGVGPFDKIGAQAASFVSYASGAAQSAVKGFTDIFAKKDAYSVGATLGSTGLTSAANGLTAKGANTVLGKQQPDARDHLFSLTSKQSFEMVEFLVMPEVVENRDVDYEAVAPVQFPGAFQKYKGTGSVVWTINATFISRTSAEATQNLQYLNRLRGWTMPYFGQNTAASKQFANMVGAPPDVLIFKGLRDSMIGPVPVVIKSLNWNWPRDVDYIPAYSLFSDEGSESAQATIPFPTVMQIAINLVESLSTAEFNRFSLEDYRRGDMKNAFGRIPKEVKEAVSTSVPTTQEAQKIAPGAAIGALGIGAAASSVGGAIKGGVAAGQAAVGAGIGAAAAAGVSAAKSVAPAIAERATATLKNVGR